MSKTYLIIVMLLMSSGCKLNKELERLGGCKKLWQYFKLTDSIKGVVLSHTKGNCGYFDLHANTIIITNNRDTIRIDAPCYVEDVVPLDSVLVKPDTSKSIGDATILDTKYDCTVRKTYRGIISKIK